MKKIMLLKKSLLRLGLISEASEIEKIKDTEYTVPSYITMELEKDHRYMGYISVDLNQKEGLIENLEDFLKKAIDANKEGLIVKDFYYSKYIRKPLKIVNGRIKLVGASTYDEDELDFFDSMPEIFDIGENTRKVKFFMENINYEDPRHFDRREEHLRDALTDKVEDLVDSGKSQSYIQDFINGFNSIDAEHINTPDYEFSIDKKSDAWISGFNFIKSLYFMGDVILDNREYIAESGGIDKALEDRYNSNDTLGRGIGIAEQYNQSGRSDNYYKMGEYLLQNGNLNGVYFDSLNQSLQSFNNVIKTKKKDQHEFYDHNKINRECSAIQISINRYFILLKNTYKVILNLKNTAKDSSSFEQKVLIGKYIEELIFAITMLLNSMTGLEERLNLLRNRYDLAKNTVSALNDIKNNQKEVYTKSLDEMKNDAEKKMDEIGPKINEVEKSNIGPKIGLNKILRIFGKQIESKD
jgi:hypothetical protein